LRKGEENTENCTGLNLFIALNYSGRAEIIDAVNKILVSGKEKITEEDFRNYLYYPDVPDPDLLIRTSGERRVGTLQRFYGLISTKKSL